jgi:signal transduction histidine kinase
MARDQGGDVTYQAREGGGSIFTLRIPVQETSTA